DAKTSDQRAALESVESIVERLPEALLALKKRENLLRDKVLLDAFDVIDGAYRIVNAAHAPTEVSYNLRMRYEVDSFDDIEAAIRDEAETPYLGVMREVFVPRVLAGDCDLVGIGMAFDGQLVPALTFARLLKEAAPELPVLAGG